MPVGNLTKAQVEKALRLTSRLTRAVDVDKDKDVRGEEIARVRVRDGFATRNLLRGAANNATYPHDIPARPAGLQAALQQAHRSMQKADKNGDGVYSTAELSRASRLARDLAKFTELHADKKVADFDIKPLEKPGTREWALLAGKEYYDPKEDQGAPRFGTAMILSRSELPVGVRKAYDAFAARHPGGKVEASSWKVNGEPAYFVHVKTDARVDAAVVTRAGKVVLEGVVKPPANPGRSVHYVAWNARWQVP
jgi:hypothetical protein